MSHPLFSLKGKKAIITGGNAGLGFGIAKAMVESGAEVCIIGRNEESMQHTVKELGEDQSTYFRYDLSDLKGIKALTNKVVAEWGTPDILVNNAGVHLKKWTFDTSIDEFQRVLDINLTAVFALSKEFGELMVDNGGGSIVLISSMAGIFGIDRVVAYSVAKTGMLGLMRTMTQEYASKGLRINSIAPGWIYSAMSDKALNADPPRKAKVMGRIPAGKMGDPQDIGLAAVYLGSDASKYVNGVLLPVDGGGAIGF